jgi:hypothetical protein
MTPNTDPAYMKYLNEAVRILKVEGPAALETLAAVNPTCRCGACLDCAARQILRAFETGRQEAREEARARARLLSPLRRPIYMLAFFRWHLKQTLVRAIIRDNQRAAATGRRALFPFRCTLWAMRNYDDVY